MTPQDMEKHGIRIVKYQIGDSDIYVEYRGAAAWAVVRLGDGLNRSEQWEYEPQPSSRDGDFMARCRFGLDEALWLAVSAGERHV